MRLSRYINYFIKHPSKGRSIPLTIENFKKSILIRCDGKVFEIRKIKDTNISRNKVLDLDMEQFMYVFNNNTMFHVFKFYDDTPPNANAVKRQYLRRVNKGYCKIFGCPRKAVKGFKSCDDHLILDRMRHKVRKELKRR